MRHLPHPPNDPDDLDHSEPNESETNRSCQSIPDCASSRLTVTNLSKPACPVNDVPRRAVPRLHYYCVPIRYRLFRASPHLLCLASPFRALTVLAFPRLQCHFVSEFAAPVFGIKAKRPRLPCLYRLLTFLIAENTATNSVNWRYFSRNNSNSASASFNN